MATNYKNRANSVNEEPKIAQKKPVKIKLSPKNVKKIKTKVTEIGPGGKEYVIKDWS